MKKSLKSRAVLWGGVLVVCGVAFGAVKIRSFDDVAEPGDADGMTIMNFNQGQNLTSNQIILSGLLPNTAYVVAVEDPNGWCQTADGYRVKFNDNFFPILSGNDGSIVSNDKGHITLHEEAHGDDYTDSDVLVFRLSDWPVPFVVGQEIPVRLIGCNPGATCSTKVCP